MRYTFCIFFMKKIFIALGVISALCMGTEVYAQSKESEGEVMEVFAPIKNLIEALNEGNEAGVQDSFSLQAQEIRGVMREDFGGQGIVYGVDCEPLEQTWEEISPEKVKITCTFLAESENWNISGLSTYFLVEKETDGVWRITETDFHEKASEKQALASLGKIFALVGGVFLLIFGAGGIFWVMMVRDCVKRDFPNKTKWIFILIFLNIFGAFLYYFMIKRNGEEVKK